MTLKWLLLGNNMKLIKKIKESKKIMRVLIFKLIHSCKMKCIKCRVWDLKCQKQMLKSLLSNKFKTMDLCLPNMTRLFCQRLSNLTICQAKNYRWLILKLVTPSCLCHQDHFLCMNLVKNLVKIG